MEETLPKRKHPRLNNYDYGSAWAYFITIGTQNRRCVLSCPTIMDIVCSYKSLTTIECKKRGFGEKLFQTSFYEHIIRGYEDYRKIVKYPLWVQGPKRCSRQQGRAMGRAVRVAFHCPWQRPA